MTQQETLSAVRTTTRDYLRAVEKDTLDSTEIEWLDWLRVRSVKRARDTGVEYAAVKAAILEGIVEAIA